MPYACAACAACAAAATAYGDPYKDSGAAPAVGCGIPAAMRGYDSRAAAVDGVYWQEQIDCPVWGSVAMTLPVSQHDVLGAVRGDEAVGPPGAPPESAPTDWEGTPEELMLPGELNRLVLFTDDEPNTQGAPPLLLLLVVDAPGDTVTDPPKLGIVAGGVRDEVNYKNRHDSIIGYCLDKCDTHHESLT